MKQMIYTSAIVSIAPYLVSSVEANNFVLLSIIALLILVLFILLISVYRHDNRQMKDNPKLQQFINAQKKSIQRLDKEVSIKEFKINKLRRFINRPLRKNLALK